jgi:hypothetical protein
MTNANRVRINDDDDDDDDDDERDSKEEIIINPLINTTINLSLNI